MSGQVDVAIEYGFVPSFPMPATDERLLLAESVALVIEVKSDLCSQWDEVRSTTERVRQLKPNLNPVLTLGQSPPERVPIAVVGYRGHRSSSGLRERLDSTSERERPDAALVIESGAFCGFGLMTDGPLGLYALCVGMNGVLSQLAWAAPDLLSYVVRKVAV